MSPNAPVTPLPLSAARTLALHTQGLTTANGAEPDPTPDTIYDTVTRLTCVQIDTLQMVRRSHYVTLWSRLGQYDPAAFERLIYDPDQRRLFEYWYHAASIIPLEEYRYRLPTMQYFQQGGGWRTQWGRDPQNQPVIDGVRARIEAEGGQLARNFKHDGAKGGTWWDWKPAKLALEYLYNLGELMIADRQNFQRVYDLRARVLPEWVDTTPPTPDEYDRHSVERAARAMGIGEAGHIADYAYRKRGDLAPVIAALVAEGVLHEVETEVSGGETRALLVHRDHVPALDAIREGAIQAGRTTFLNPFDSLLWPRGHDELLWGTRFLLEAYKPAQDRIWGYYCLAIQHCDRLIGRFDPKLERKTGTLRLKALYLEPSVELSDPLVADVAAALRDFMAWHGAHDLVIERSDPAAFGDRLLAEIG